MATITYDAQAPGQGRVAPVFAAAPRRLKLVTGQFSFDSSYPTGGESIADIFAQFTSLLGIWMADPTASAGTGKKTVIDYTAQTVMLYDNAAAPAQVGSASDQSGAASLRFLAWGY